MCLLKNSLILVANSNKNIEFGKRLILCINPERRTKIELSGITIDRIGHQTKLAARFKVWSPPKLN